MGKITMVAMSMMLAFFLIGLYSSAMMNASTDANRTEFVKYGAYANASGLGSSNVSAGTGNNTVSNMQREAQGIAQTIADAQQDLNSDNLAEQVLGAFGLMAALSVKIIILLLAVLMDGLNFVGGVASNLGSLPTPWNMFASIAGIGVALFTVFMVFKVAAAVLKWDI